MASPRLLLHIVAVSALAVLYAAQEPEVKVCSGRQDGLMEHETPRLHYQKLVEAYINCTHIIHNVEITHFLHHDINYDLNFLRTIQYVGGYVLIAYNLQMRDTIPFDNLEVIRGNATYRDSHNLNLEYSLVVMNNANLKRLHMPKLKEISNGMVLFRMNSALGYVDTIDWNAITNGIPTPVNYVNTGVNISVSEQTPIPSCPGGHGWDNSPLTCQQGRKLPRKKRCYCLIPPCNAACKYRCYRAEADNCCHSSCAGGCSSDSNIYCNLCKDYKYNGGCVGFCPAGTNASLPNCVLNSSV